MSDVSLSAAERETRAIWWAHSRADCRPVYPTKGAMQDSLRATLLALGVAEARLARVEALADEWKTTAGMRTGGRTWLSAAHDLRAAIEAKEWKP